MEENEEKSMSLVEHLQELRIRLIRIMIFFIVALIGGFFLTNPVIRFFHESTKSIIWNAFALSDPVRVYLQFAFFIALTFTIPLTLFELWRFVSPGLTSSERKATVWFIPIAFILFLTGVSFAYFIIFPMIVRFLTNIATQLGINQVYGFVQYFGFMFNMIIPFGILFELPIVVIFLTRIGIVNPELLTRFRKFAYLILVILAASITPPELISEILVSVPLILLYEFSIWLSKLTVLKRRKAKKEKTMDDNKNK